MILKSNRIKKMIRLAKQAGIACFVVFVFLIGIFLLRKGPDTGVSFSKPRKVLVQFKNNGYQLCKDGKPFIIKGGAGYTFMKELVAAGGNTIICWDTAKLEAVLNGASENHLSVIVGLDLPNIQYYDIYKDSKKKHTLFSAYQRLVSKYKNHPALLAWCLGNELVFPYSPAYDAFYTAYNQILVDIHTSDPHHPVCTTVINITKKYIFNIRWRIPSLDFIGFNIYNSLKTMQDELNFIRLCWNGPYFISEWAPQGGWEAPQTSWGAPIEKSSTQKAKDYQKFFNQYLSPDDKRFLGSMVFYWGCRSEYTNTWYNIFAEDSTATEIKEVIADGWNARQTQHQSPLLLRIAMDTGLVATDNILLAAGSSHTACAVVKVKEPREPLWFSWQLVPDDWTSWNTVWTERKKIPALTGLIKDSTLPAIVFSTPLKEGPYRICVCLRNAKGYSANANIPFYVIQ